MEFHSKGVEEYALIAKGSPHGEDSPEHSIFLSSPNFQKRNYTAFASNRRRTVCKMPPLR